jgi:hypothetical protein
MFKKNVLKIKNLLYYNKMNSVSSKKISDVKPAVKKNSLPSYQEYLDAIAYIKKSNTDTPFSNFEEVNELMKNLQIIKVCERANYEKMKKSTK